MISPTSVSRRMQASSSMRIAIASTRRQRHKNVVKHTSCCSDVWQALTLWLNDDDNDDNDNNNNNKNGKTKLREATRERLLDAIRLEDQVGTGCSSGGRAELVI
mmetsp:Transcript_79406/g.174172  ORF Transcript_79406/g.174172 Transcript_79406/m.174172 type:complete len:104 (-) Transcript_79406:75-386(-)